MRDSITEDVRSSENRDHGSNSYKYEGFIW